MAVTTFGEELKSLRIKAGISQFKLAVCMDWQGVSPVIQIEKGRRLPKPDTISKLVECLSGNFADECRLMGLAGHLPSMTTIVPKLSQIKGEMNTLIEDIAKYRYPIYVLDLTGIFWVVNPAALSLIDKGIAIESISGSSVLDLVFNQNLSVKSRLDAKSKIFEEQILRFRAFNVLHQHEPYYMAYPEIMKDRFSDEDYQFFKNAWDKSKGGQLDKERSSLKEDGIGYLKLEVEPGKSIDFRLLIDRYLPSLAHFFEVVHFIPLEDKTNRDLAENMFPLRSDEKEECFRLWDLIDAEQLLNKYRRGAVVLNNSKD